jgi:hypothetical protein
MPSATTVPNCAIDERAGSGLDSSSLSTTPGEPSSNVAAATALDAYLALLRNRALNRRRTASSARCNRTPIGINIATNANSLFRSG